MAKWGEGDPRWLVEDRPDATNVNNWHWTEKNASQWSKERLSELLVGIKIENEFGCCEITEMSKCDGEAAVNNRKAKLIFFYEWAIELKWKGVLKNDTSDEPVNGTLEVLNLSEEHEIKDVDINVILEKAGPEADVFKDLMRSKGIEIVRHCLSKYLKCLKEEFSKGIILPTKDSSIMYTQNKRSVNLQEDKVRESGPLKYNAMNQIFETSDFKTTETFKCRSEEFYRVMTTKEMVEAFTRGNCTLQPVEGGKFELYGGNVYGCFVELIPNKVIKQKWRFKSWPEGCYSDVSITINEKFDCTDINVVQTGIPKCELENTCEGWKKYYWESIKRTFGFGAILF